MNVLKPDKKAAIITLLNNGISQREIHSKVRVDRKTIRKYARIQSQCNEKSKSPGVATGFSDTSGQNPPTPATGFYFN